MNKSLTVLLTSHSAQSLTSYSSPACPHAEIRFLATGLFDFKSTSFLVTGRIEKISCKQEPGVVDLLHYPLTGAG